MPGVFERFVNAARALMGVPPAGPVRLRTGARAAFPARPRAASPAPASGGDVKQWATRVVEKIRTASLGGRLRLLPYFDTYTDETPDQRRAYRVMMREPTLKAALGTKVLAVTQLPVQLHPEDHADPRQREAADFGLYAFRKVRGGPPKVGWSILSGLLIEGHTVCEKVWVDPPQKEGRFGLKRRWADVKGKDTQFISLSVDAYKNVQALSSTAYNPNEVFDPRDFVVASYLPLFESPGGMSDFRAPYRAYWFKDTIWKLRGLHLDKYTGPYLKGTYAGPEQKAALDEALEQARANTWVTVPAGALIEAVDMSGRGTADFRDAIQDCDREMLVGTVGAYLQILEGQVSDGRGDTGVHKETSELFQWLLAAQLGNIYREQMLAELYEENYAGVPVADVTLGSVSDTALEARARVDAALQAIGVRLSKKEAYNYYGRQEPADEEDVLTPGGGPAVPGGGPAT